MNFQKRFTIICGAVFPSNNNIYTTIQQSNHAKHRHIVRKWPGAMPLRCADEIPGSNQGLQVYHVPPHDPLVDAYTDAAGG